MDTSNGDLHRVRTEAEAQALMEASLEAIRAERMPEKLLVPDDQLSIVQAMNRHERRRWAREEAKRLAGRR